MKFKIFRTILVLFFLNFSKSYSADLAGTIQIKGSDTMVNLGQAWAEAFSKKNPKINVAVTGGGSGTGIAGLLNGTCNMAESSRKMKDKEFTLAKSKNILMEEHIVGLDGIAVAVHPINAINKLTIDELRDIFMGKIKNWKELGGKDLKIVILSREVNSGTHVFFKEHVLRKGNEKGPEEFDSSALLMPSSQAIADEIAQNKNAIGYYGMGYMNSKNKTVSIAKDKKSNYFTPTLENVKTQKYPISRPLFVYTTKPRTKIIDLFINFIFSIEGQSIVKKTDFVPIK
jgi:phosphate transport system substrate-binding protein